MTIADIVTLARTETVKHGFGHIPIKTDRSRRRLGGMGHRGPEVLYFVFSSVLMPLLSEAECLDTIRHEIAHAMTPEAHHDAAWQAAAISVGARPARCAAVNIDAKMAGYKYIAACACGPTEHGKCRRPTRTVRCAKCKVLLAYVQQY